MAEQTWKEFSRRKTLVHKDGFFGCLSRDGVWFDSGDTFAIAVHWCAMEYGESNLTRDQEMEWMNSEGRRLGLSIVHSDMLEKMWEKGLIE